MDHHHHHHQLTTSADLSFMGDELGSGSATFLGEDGETAVVIDSSMILDNGTLIMDPAQFAAIFGSVQADQTGEEHGIVCTAAPVPLTPLSENHQQNRAHELLLDTRVGTTVSSEPVTIHTLSTPSTSFARRLDEGLGKLVAVTAGDRAVPSTSGLGLDIVSSEIENLQPDGSSDMIEVEPPTGKGPYRCEECGKVFMKWPHFKRHKSEHLDMKNFKCPICLMSFNVEVNLKLHEMIHQAELSGCLECQMCPAKFSRLASLKSHIRVHEKEENLVCPECGDEFATKARLDTHIEEHKTTKPLVHRCRLCGKTFTHAAFLKEHSKEHTAVRNQLRLLGSRRKRPMHLRLSSSTNPDADAAAGSSRARNKEAKRKLLCDVCSKRFEKPSQLTRHMRIHTGEKPYACNTCGKSFNQKNTLDSHVLSMHEKLKPHTCHLCNCQFSQRGNLRAHIMKVHVEPGNGQQCFKCQDCPCVFRKLASLNSHIAKIHSKKGTEESLDDKNSTQEGRSIFADVTKDMENNVMLIVPSDLSSIIGTASDDQGNTHVVISTSFLGASLAPREDISEVKLVHEAGGKQSTYTVKVKRVGPEKLHLCPYDCTKSFKKPSDLIRHIRIHTQERPYTCSICKRSFSIKSTLTTHMKTHSEHKDWECRECHKRFTVLTSLRAHERLHTGAKPFPCMQCGKPFRTSAQRRMHLTVHTRNTHGLTGKRKLLRIGDTEPKIDLPNPLKITSDGLVVPVPVRSVQALVAKEGAQELKIRPYRCSMCPSAFKKSSHLKQHVRSHTGERPYKCFQCYRSFISSGVLKNHIKTHEGVRAFKCKLCQLSFTTNGSLTRHMATHTDERSYMCPYCRKAFKTSVACRKHIKTHRNEFVALRARDGSDGDPIHNADDGFNADPVEISTHSGVLSEQDRNHLHEACVPNIGLQRTTATTSSILQSSVFTDSFISSTLHQETLDNNGSHSFQYSLSGANTRHTEVISDVHGFEASVFPLPESDGLDLPVSLSLASIMPQPTHTTQAQMVSSSAIQTTSLSVGDKSTNLVDASAGSALSSMQQSIVPPMHPEPEIDLPEVACVQTVVSSEDPTIMEAEDIQENSEHVLQPRASQNHIDMHELITKNLSDIEKGKVNFCTQCGRGFKKRSDLVRHTRIHTGEKPFKCNVCGKAFRVKSTREAHMRVHEGGKTVACHICSNLFSTKSSLHVHLRLHTGARPYKCPHCDRTFRTSGHRKAHVGSHFKPTKETKQFSTSMSHPEANASNNQKQGVASALPPVETIREKVGISTAGLQLHENPTIFTTSNSVPTVSSTNMTDSIQVIGSLQVVQDGSQVSNIHLGGLDLTNLHISEELLQGIGNVIFVTSQTNPIIAGDLQNMGLFGSNISIRTDPMGDNQTTTDGQRPPTSSTVLTSQHNLNSSTVSISDLETLIPGDGSLIGFSSTFPSGNVLSNNSPLLSSTATSVTNNPTTPSANKSSPETNNKQCPTCHKVFAKPSLLNRHMTVHTGVKPFKCDVCSQTFNQKNSLDVHKYTHTSERPFSCTLCAFKTVVKQALKKHVSRAHPNANFEDMLNVTGTETNT